VFGEPEASLEIVAAAKEREATFTIVK